MDGRDAMLALGMNGEPLPFEHGFPVRMVVPGLYGYVSACKWIEDIELTTFDAYDPYWVKRSWARKAPIKTESRIDTPKPLRPSQGRHRHGRRGRLGPAPRASTRSRSGSTTAPGTRPAWPPRTASTPGVSGPTRGRPREAATPSRSGPPTAPARSRPAERTRTIPDGASGRHSVVVTVD